jgi:soluble lytic murein transglycosylase-like protein
MPNRRLPAVASYVVILLGLTSTADAQIYTWRDQSGTLVLSNKRPGSELRTFAVPEAPTVRATQPVPTAKARQFDDLIEEHASRHRVRTDLVRAVVQVESAFNPHAKSPKGAMGLMQLMPATMRQFKVLDAFNPAENIRAGVAYLRQLLDRYGNNEQLALAAYNAGPGAVDKYGATVPPYRETKNYVVKIAEIAGKNSAPVSGTKIYKIVEVVNGREVVRYSDQKP